MRFFLYAGFIFSLLNLYILWRVHAAFGTGPWQWPALGFTISMIVLALRRRAIPKIGCARYMYGASLIWGGVIFITVPWLATLDIARCLAWLIDLTTGSDIGFLLRPEVSIPIVLGLCSALIVYSLIEAACIRTTHKVIVTDKLPEGMSRLRMVVMSDIHISSISSKHRLARMAAIASRAKGDLVLMLGDLVDTDMHGRDAEAAILKSIPASHGKFAVLGNHEAYNGEQNALHFTRKAGFSVLRNQAVIAGGVAVAGIDDAMFLADRRDGSGSEENMCLRVLEGMNQERQEGRFILLLRHRPGTHKSIAGLFDLQLSGHTHGGQIWPARYLAEKANGIASGLATVTGEYGSSLVYVTPGTGTWGPPMRLFTPPEVTVIDLVDHFPPSDSA